MDRACQSCNDDCKLFKVPASAPPFDKVFYSDQTNHEPNNSFFDDLNNALKHPIYKNNLFTLWLAKFKKKLASENISLWLKKKRNKSLNDLKKDLEKSKNKKVILEQRKEFICLDERFFSDNKHLIKIISINIEMRENQIKFLEEIIQEKEKNDHTNNTNKSENSSTEYTFLYPNLNQDRNPFMPRDY